MTFRAGSTAVPAGAAQVQIRHGTIPFGTGAATAETEAVRIRTRTVSIGREAIPAARGFGRPGKHPRRDFVSTVEAEITAVNAASL